MLFLFIVDRVRGINEYKFGTSSQRSSLPHAATESERPGEEVLQRHARNIFDKDFINVEQEE